MEICKEQQKYLLLVFLTMIHGGKKVISLPMAFVRLFECSVLLQKQHWKKLEKFRKNSRIIYYLETHFVARFLSSA